MNRRAPIFVGIGVVVAIVLVLLVLVMPQRGKVSDAQAALETAQAAELTLRTELEGLLELKKSAPEFQRQLDQAKTLIPEQADIPGLIRNLQLVANKTGVDFAVLGVSNPQLSEQGDFSAIALTITISGTFIQVSQYLFEIEHLPRALKILNVTVSPTEYPTLSSNLSVETYTTDIASGPGTQPGSQAAEGG
ncbi:MAG: type 4a pilus biogenesis protein PilO [Actinomycetota bacterium]